MSWTEHVIWWQVYPLGALGAPVRGVAPADAAAHRLPRLTPWLDHVVDLGANGLLLGPVFAAAGHGYDTVDHFRLDPRLGDDADLDALIAAAHARGVRVALDGVFNHVADTHPLYLRALADGPTGRYADWFRIDWDAPGGPRAAVFEGHGALVELNHASPEVADLVTDVLTHWTARGVDGWRLDAAYAVDPAFWARVLPTVRTRQPDVWFLAEVIHGDYARFVADSTVDTLTQYQLWKAIWSSLVDRNFFELDWALRTHDELLARFTPQTFVGNHDVTRLASRVGARHAVLATTVLMTVGGVPSVYAGDETAATGVKEEREGGDDAVRPELGEPTLGHGEPMFRAHQELIGLRRRHPWLVTARSQAVELTNTRYVYRSSPPDGSDWLQVELDVDAVSAVVRGPDGELFRFA